MRQEVIDSIKALSPNSVSISTELPYDESGIELYVKNPKTIYIDAHTVEIDNLFSTLNGLNFSTTTNVVRIYFTTDAKKPIFNYSALVTQLYNLKDAIAIDGIHTRTATVSTSYAGDLLTTQIEYRLSKLN